MTRIELQAMAALVLLALAFIGGHHVGERDGAAKLAQVKAAAADASIKAQAQFQADHTAMETKFNDLSAKYKAVTDANPPAVADSVSAGLSDGSLRLRHADVCAAGGQTAAAAARSRAADAAATQALADRVANSIAAVRAGDAADKRERDLGAQVTSLQALLQAERQ